MTRDEQFTFVKDLTKSIRDEILTHIVTNKIPEDWDGHELRELLADKFVNARSRTLRDASGRRHAYLIIVTERNL